MSRRANRNSHRVHEGFSLIEVLVATAVVTVGVASLAQLFVAAAHTNRLAQTTSTTLLLAEQKMEQLRGETASSASPSDALSVDTRGYIDYLDTTGTSLATDSLTPPAGTAYVRRWSIEPLPGSPVNTVVLQVLVIPWPSRDQGGHSRVTRVPGEARLVSLKADRSR